MRILLATDAWEPQVNGVVRTLSRVVAELRAMGHQIELVTPGQFATVPLPTYPEIKLALGAYESMQDRFKAFEPEAIHIATEGPLGLAARGLKISVSTPRDQGEMLRKPCLTSSSRMVGVATISRPDGLWNHFM